MNTFAADRIRIGTLPGGVYGFRRTVTLFLRAEVQVIHHKATTVEHERVTEFARLSLSGELWVGPHNYAAGQVRGDLSRVTRFAPGFDAASLARVAEIWERWHLNDMRAACAHQTIPATPAHVRPVDLISWRLGNVRPCPVTGYGYGKEWLVEPLPADVATELRELLHIDQEA